MLFHVEIALFQHTYVIFCGFFCVGLSVCFADVKVIVLKRFYACGVLKIL